MPGAHDFSPLYSLSAKTTVFCSRFRSGPYGSRVVLVMMLVFVLVLVSVLVSVVVRVAVPVPVATALVRLPLLLFAEAAACCTQVCTVCC